MFREEFSKLAASWSQFDFKDHAEYLGFVLGPSGRVNMWSNVVAKALDTTNRWKQIGAGFFFNVIAANVFILSLFAFVGQLASPDDLVKECITTIRNALFSGPGNWLPPCILNNLKELGFPVQARDPFASMLASKVRVALTSQLDLNTICTELALHKLHWQRSHTIDHPHWLWHQDALIFNVICARRTFCSTPCPRGMPIQDIREKCLNGDGGQKLVYEFITQQAVHQPATIVFNKLRHRCERWETRFPIPIGHVNQRLENRFHFLKGCTKPSLIAVYLRTVLNGWITERRMRTLQTTLDTKCPFCRGATDAIEHFVHCRVVINLYRQHGITISPPNSFVQFLGLMHEDLGPRLHTIVKLLSVLYSSHNTLRHNRDLHPHDVLRIAVYAIL